MGGSVGNNAIERVRIARRSIHAPAGAQTTVVSPAGRKLASRSCRCKERKRGPVYAALPRGDNCVHPIFKYYILSCPLNMGCVGKQQVSPARSKTYQRDGFAKFSLANGLENDSRQDTRQPRPLMNTFIVNQLIRLIFQFRFGGKAANCV
ncbi:hypothetical protein OUZ56_009043 [Daphnia magna]|uniref:Uncharacterized protein n=1 Tax=Daphnia magna TaxID=35525 RepID=A0ABR0AEV6_9CRUS|nr:hypothetical protein OUZ56_009043 [Daphnia magna]